MRDYALGTTFDVKFTTRKFTTGAPFTLGSSPVISAYPDNSTTEITAGITLSVDFDSRTGLNNIRVVATTGNGYATATNYALVITTGTVDSVSVVGEVVAEFSIEAQSPLRPTVTARTLDVTATGAAGIDWANVENPTTALNLSATNIDVDQIVASVSGAVGSVTGAVGSVTGNVGGNVTGSVGSVVGAVGSVTGAVGSVTGNVGGNVTGSVGSVAANGITSSSLDATAITEIEDGVWDAVLANHLDAGSTGEALSNAGAAGDPWGTALPGAYAAGTAGFIVGTNLDDTITSRASATQATNIQTDVDDIQSRLPTALISGRMNSDVEAINNTVVNGAGVLGNEWGP